MRTGSRIQTDLFTLFISREATSVTRFGFVVSKTVGNAVIRNRVKRQLRAIAFYFIQLPIPRDVVIRVSPAASNTTFNNLKLALSACLSGAGN